MKFNIYFNHKYLLIGLLSCMGVFVVFSTVLCFFLYSETLRFYRELQRVNLDPGSQLRFLGSSDWLSDAPNQLRVVMFGDSRIAGWKPELTLPDFQIINRGVGGETTARSLLRIHRDVLELSPDVVIIQIGINDLKAIGVFGDKKEQIIERCQNHIQEIIRLMADADIHPVVLTIFPVGPVQWYRRPIWSSQIEDSVSQVNQWIRTLDGTGVTIIDCDSFLISNERLKKEYFEDWLHLNREGYRHLNVLVSHSINELIPTFIRQENK